jgi:hypothetical protein
VKTLIAPLFAASAAVLAIPTAQASTIVDQVDIIDGKVDVDESGSISYRDAATDVLLFFDNVAPIRVDIIDGLVDVTEGGVVNSSDDLMNVDLNHVVALAPTRNQVDIIDGFVDVNEGGTISTADDLTDVKVVKLVGSLVDQVDVVGAEVDVDEDQIVGGPLDDATDVLLAFNDSALIRVDIIDGQVDVTENGLINQFDSLGGNVYLNVVLIGIPSSQEFDIVHAWDGSGGYVFPDRSDIKLVKLVGSVVDKVDIVDGQVDVTESGTIDTADDLADVLLIFDNAAPIRVDIIDGRVDVTENGSVTTADDLPNTELTREHVGYRVYVPVDIIDGKIDVDESGSITSADDLGDVRLVVP